jgi:TolB-like protein/Tfp pilus assembly protein PilF
MLEESLPAGAVFLSYASQDAEAAARICEALRAAGVEVWFDRSELRGGDAWDSQIKKQIHDCALFVPIISVNTNARTEGYFRREWKLATRRLLDIADDAAFLVPVVIDETQDAAARVPEEFLHVQWSRLPGGETPPQFAWRVRELLGLDRSAAPVARLVATRTIVRPHGTHLARRVGLALTALLLVVGSVIFWRYQNSTGSSSAVNASNAIPATGSRASSAALNDRSIAVLPFENRSREADDQYFVDGVHDDILTQLSKLSALKVTSRTSVEQFQGARVGLREIAEQLGVATILEGGVQRVGDRVRINVQLIDARTDAHLWAESYDRKLSADNIFAIQSEIASSIAHALRTTLTPLEHERLAVIPTRNLDAWKDYQLGRRRLEQRNSAALGEAAVFFQKAIDRDPDFALAYAGLAETLQVQMYFSALPRKAVMSRADMAVAKALALDRNLGGAHATAAALSHARREFSKAEAGFHKAIELDPNYSTTRLWYGFLLMRLGRFPESQRQMELAAELDPLSSRAQSMVASSLGRLGRLDEALQRLDRAVEIDPSVAISYSIRGTILSLGLNRWDAAIPWWEQAQQSDPDSPLFANWLALAHAELGLDSDSKRWSDLARSLGAEVVYPARTAALIHVYRGDLEQSAKAAERALTIWPADTIALRLLRDVDLRAGRPVRARARYAVAFPELVAPGVPQLDTDSFIAAVDLALVLQQTGENARAELLLNRASEFLRSLGDSVLNGSGLVEESYGSYGIADARIDALHSRPSEALAQLRQAEQRGWRAGWRYYRDHDPVFTTIRNEPEFKAVFADIERDMAQQRARLAARRKVASHGSS